jgi:hypothetical protein
MKSQWECLLENLGEWHGSFTQLSPQGDVVQDIPTIVALIGLNENRTIRQTIRRLTPIPEETVLEYSSLGRGILLHENGAFSQGSLQLAPFMQFGAELGLIQQNHRLRLVQLFNAESQLSQLTLIREHRVGTDPHDRPTLSLAALLGTWEGSAVTIYPTLTIDRATVRLTLSQQGDFLQQEMVLNPDSAAPYQLSSKAAIAGNVLRFEDGNSPVQVVLLPDGASSTSPTQVRLGQPFFLEVGWLVQSDQRQRLIRRYNKKGEWVSLTLVTEQKVN